jgi:hypothetical protein
MNERTKKQMADAIRELHLPRFDELPNVGYYLEQTVTYINQCIEPLGCAPITSAMVGNYAKKNTSETNGQINSVNEENNVVEEGVQLKNHQD